MKQFLLTILCITLFSTFMTAQITITRANYAVHGTLLDSAAWKQLTKTGAVLPTLGNNQVWDYSALKDSLPTVNKYYHTPVASFGATPTAFADATYAFNYTTTFQAFSYSSRAYEKVDANGYSQLGYITSGGRFSISAISGGAADSLIFPASVNRFSSPLTIYKFPITANSVWKSSYKDTSNFQLTITAFGLNSTPGARVSQYNYIDTIVGWGTLKLRNPSGGTALSYAVLLQRENLIRVDSFFLAGAAAPALLLSSFGLTQGLNTVTPASYYFLGVGFNEPFLSISTTAAGGINNISRAVIPSLGLTTNNKETPDYKVATKVYPNPTTEGVTFEFKKTNAAKWNVMIYNAAGQIVSIDPIIAPQGFVNQRITLDAVLPSGTYFYNLLDETSLIRANGQFMLNH